MKTKNLLLLLAVGAIATLTNCGGDGNSTSTDHVEKPLNISVYIDLSDRLRREMTPSQKERDLAIIDYLADYFKEHTLGPKVLQSKNNMKIFFYPTPNIPKIAQMADSLSVDIAKPRGVAKRQALEGMKETFRRNLSEIYDSTLVEKNWVGCDIWGFFYDKKVDAQCIRKDARNILFILTDGYFYDDHNKKKDGNAYSYILPQTLNIPNSSLIPRTNPISEDLEVMILEVNLHDQKHRDKMKQVMEDWFEGVGVKGDRLQIVETDLLPNIQPSIEKFLEQK